METLSFPLFPYHSHVRVWLLSHPFRSWELSANPSRTLCEPFWPGLEPLQSGNQRKWQRMDECSIVSFNTWAPMEGWIYMDEWYHSTHQEGYFPCVVPWDSSHVEWMKRYIYFLSLGLYMWMNLKCNGMNVCFSYYFFFIFLFV